MTKDENIQGGRPFVFEEGGAVSFEAEAGVPEVNREHFVQYEVIPVGPYNLMIGKDQHGEQTKDFAIIDARNGQKSFKGQDPGEVAFYRALEQGHELRRQG